MTECERFIEEGIFKSDFFKPETRCDFFVDENRKKIWAVELDLLFKFDAVCKKLDFNVFKVFRDRQITNKLLTDIGDIRVLKSRNISDDGKNVIDIDGYDSYISSIEARSLSVFEYLQRD